MGSLEDAETYMLVKDLDSHVAFESAKLHFVSSGRKADFDVLQHLIAISYKFQETGERNSFMFIGSAGILANVVDVAGIGAVEQFRPIHDLDILVSESPYATTVGSALDCITRHARSLSIPNKITINGNCVAADGSNLLSVGIDVYNFQRTGSEDIEMHQLFGTFIHEGHWEERTKADFFGVPVYAAPPVPLLEMKLNVVCGNGSLRRQDCYDVRNLLGVLEHQGVKPEFLKQWVSPEKIRRLPYVLNGTWASDSAILESSKQYKRCLVK